MFVKDYSRGAAVRLLTFDLYFQGLELVKQIGLVEGPCSLLFVEQVVRERKPSSVPLVDHEVGRPSANRIGHTLEIFSDVKAPGYRLISSPLRKPESPS